MTPLQILVFLRTLINLGKTENDSVCRQAIASFQGGKSWI